MSRHHAETVSPDWVSYTSGHDRGTILAVDSEGNVVPWTPTDPGARLAGVVTASGLHGWRTVAPYMIADPSLRTAEVGAFVFCASGLPTPPLSTRARFSTDPSTSAAPPVGIVSEPGFVRVFSVAEAAAVALAWTCASKLGLV